MPVALSRSSELAKIAAEAAGVDTSSVRFVVTHNAAGADTEPIWRGTWQGQMGEPEVWPTDFSLFSAAGMSMSASAWPSPISAFAGPVHMDQPTVIARASTYSGLSVPNPGSLNESTRRIDVLVTLGSTPWSPLYRDCLMNALVIERLSNLAMERGGGPVLHLHTPVAPFSDQHVSERGDGSSERLRDAIGPCIRMSVGVDPNTSNARLDFEVGLTALAEEYGLGLKLDDRRFNRVRGEWFTIRGFDRERYRYQRNRLFPQAPMLPPKRALIATLVGPARVGMTVQLIAALRARGIGVVAASISSMRRIAFINLVLPAAVGTRPLPQPWTGDWDDAMKTLASRCAPDRSWQGDETGDESVVTDCKFAVSAPMRCSFPPSSRRTGASTTGRIPYPLWLRWEMPHRAMDTPRLLAQVQANLKPYAEQCDVAYAQSRLVRSDVVRGRAKLIVVLLQGPRDHARAQQQLTDVALRTQEQTLEELLAVREIERARARLRISPRERWLAYA